MLFLNWTQIQGKIRGDGMALSDYHNIKYFDWLKMWFKLLKCFILNSIRSDIRWNLDVVRNERHNLSFQPTWPSLAALKIYYSWPTGELLDEDIYIVGYCRIYLERVIQPNKIIDIYFQHLYLIWGPSYCIVMTVKQRNVWSGDHIFFFNLNKQSQTGSSSRFGGQK